MNFGYRRACLDHDTGPRHPENAERLRRLRSDLESEHGVTYVEDENAAVESIEAVHDEEYVARIEEFCADGGGQWDPDTVAVEATWEAALASAGLAIGAAERALEEPPAVETPFSLGRPPGHHAVADDAMGFCFFNNTAIAAQHVLDTTDVERVAIVDWDVHHGNGIQDVFYDRADVFYASIHEDGLYPGTGAVEETGTPGSDRTNMNVPFPPGSGDGAYLAAMESITTAIERFGPDVVLTSAGFDAHERDPISRMCVSTECYGELTVRLRELAARLDVGLGFVLEGGYSHETLSESVRIVNEVCNGYEPVDSEDSIEDGAMDVLESVRRTHGIE